MSKHTKGKWDVNGLYVISRQNEEDYIRICQILSSDADARLIAAAPDLLEALIGLRSRLGNAPNPIGDLIWGDSIDKADAAITKAKKG